MPEEYVTTPRAACSSVSWRMALLAPRILKELVRWKFSHLKPQMASSPALVSTGVRCTSGAIRRAAARMSAEVGMVTIWKLPGVRSS